MRKILVCLFVLLALALTAIPAAGQYVGPTFAAPGTPVVFPTPTAWMNEPPTAPTQAAYPAPIPYPAPPTGVDLVDLSAESNTPFVFGVTLLVVAIAGLVAAGARRKRK
jgi:hypothetical protein